MAFDFKNFIQSTGITPGPVDWTNLAASAINNTGGWSGLADMGVNAAVDFFGRKGGADTSFDGQQQFGNMLMKSGNPYLKAAGAAYKGFSALGEATGININTLDNKQVKKAGINWFEQQANNALSYIPMAGVFSGDTNKAHMSQETQQYSGAYSGSYDDISTAQSMGGKTYLFGKNKANNFINEANNRDHVIAQLGRLNTYRKQSDMADTYDRQNYRRYQGTDFNSTAVGKNGMKLISKAEAANLLAKGGRVKPELSVILSDLLYLCTGIEGLQQSGSMLEEEVLRKKGQWNYQHESVDDAYNKSPEGVRMKLQMHLKEYMPEIQSAFKDDPEALQALASGNMEVFTLHLANKLGVDLNQMISQTQSFQNGGVIGVDTNILPEGALHKNKNNIEDINPEIGSEVTEKGIPVISVNESGEITQVAEIEKEEIILRKEVTTKLEELWKDGSEEAMIEAGRLLSEEIITNTQDNTGQLENGNDISNNQK